MDIGTWLAIPGVVVACGAIVGAGIKAAGWLRKRRAIQPGVWVIDPSQPPEPEPPKQAR